MARQERPVRGERIVITGATNGIGKEIARALVRRGADVTIIARNQAKAADTAAELAAEPGAVGTPDIVVGDLADLASVRRAAEELHERYDHIDVLVNNAGIHSTTPGATVDGYDLMMGTNHLGPFLLTNLVLDLVEKGAPSRIVVTASEAHRGSAGRPAVATLGDPVDFRGAAGGQIQYGRSKLMNILFTAELGRRLAGTGVTVNCFCPGTVATGLIGADSAIVQRGGELLTRTPLLRRPDQGARMGLRLVLDPDLGSTSGEFFTSTPGLRFLPAVSARRDLEYQRAIWERSEQLVGLA